MFDLNLRIKLGSYDELISALDKARETLLNEFPEEHSMFVAVGKRVKFRFEIEDDGGSMDMLFDYDPGEDA
jgi:hypothetical protein